MANGFFLGGMAEGMQLAEALGIKRDTLSADTALRGRGLDIQEAGLGLREREMAQNQDFRTRQLGIQEQGMKNAQQRAAWSMADKQINDTMSLIGQTISEGLKANQDPLKIAKTVQPLVADIKGLAAKAGRKPDTIDLHVQALFARPNSIETAVAGANTKVEAARAVSSATGIPEREAMQGQGLVRAEPREPNTVESIRGKIAAGEQLTAGEQRVYDDALKANSFDTLMRNMVGAGTPGAASAPAAPLPAPAAPVTPPPTAPLPPEALKTLKEGTVTTFKNGQKWTLRNGQPVQVP